MRKRSDLDSGRSGEGRTLQFRVTAAVVVIFLVTLIVFTVIDVAGERSAYLRGENRHAVVVLTHLAAMANARPVHAEVAREIASFNVQLRSAGAHVELIPAGLSASQEAGAPASRRLLLDGGRPYEIRYRVHEGMMRQAVVNAMALHLFHGLIAVAAIVAVTELLVRRRLIRPLALMTHQLAHMRKGGGWIASLPAVDAELTPITEAISDLGPVLEQQVKEWVEAERRAGVALAFQRVESQTREPLNRAQSLVRDLEALHTDSDDMERIRSLRAEIDEVSAVVSDGRLWAGEFGAVTEEVRELEQSRLCGQSPRKESHARQ